MTTIVQTVVFSLCGRTAANKGRQHLLVSTSSSKVAVAHHQRRYTVGWHIGGRLSRGLDCGDPADIAEHPVYAS